MPVAPRRRTFISDRVGCGDEVVLVREQLADLRIVEGDVLENYIAWRRTGLYVSFLNT